MGIDEAVEIIKSMRPGCGEKPTYTEGELCKAYDMAIKALEEIQQYREIGTVEECREARERRNPKKVVDICGALGEKYECPECGSSLDDADLIAGNCKWCGQKLYE